MSNVSVYNLFEQHGPGVLLWDVILRKPLGYLWWYNPKTGDIVYENYTTGFPSQLPSISTGYIAIEPIELELEAFKEYDTERVIIYSNTSRTEQRSTGGTR